MVFFICNGCGETLKRNKIEMHYKSKCRNCEVLSCVDCSKEFWGDEYKKHMTCISEEEKYSGSNYVAKPNKGEMKQELWHQAITKIVEQNKQNPKLRDLLTRLIDHPNIPRKQRKFENFMKSSFGIQDNKMISEVWEILSKATLDNKTEEQSSVNGKTDTSDPSADKTNNDENTEEQSLKKVSKREKKEQRKLKSDKKEKKDKHKNGAENADETKTLKKKKKNSKRKHEESEEEEIEETKSEKRQRLNEDDNNKEEESENDEEEVETIMKKRKIKFDWEQTILTVLKTKGEDIPVKKLRKKVLSEYASQGGCIESEGELYSKFNKKLKNPKFKVLKDKVKLVKNK